MKMSKSNSKHNGKQLTEGIWNPVIVRSKLATNLQSHYSVSSLCNRIEHQMSHPAIGALWQLVQFNICNICNSKGAKRHRRPCSLFTLFSFTPLWRRQKRWRAKITISGSFLGCQRANPFSLASKSIFASMQIHSIPSEERMNWPPKKKVIWCK